jgi:hypothetical protein
VVNRYGKEIDRDVESMVKQDARAYYKVSVNDVLIL